MSGEVTPVKAGMSLGAGGPPPLSDQVAGGHLRGHLRASLRPPSLLFHLQGENFLPKAVAMGSSMTAPQ